MIFLGLKTLRKTLEKPGNFRNLEPGNFPSFSELGFPVSRQVGHFFVKMETLEFTLLLDALLSGAFGKRSSESSDESSGPFTGKE